MTDTPKPPATAEAVQALVEATRALVEAKTAPPTPEPTPEPEAAAAPPVEPAPEPEPTPEPSPPEVSREEFGALVSSVQALVEKLSTPEPAPEPEPAPAPEAKPLHERITGTPAKPEASDTFEARLEAVLPND